MEKFQHTFGRLLAAAAFVGGAVASAPSSGLTITVNGSCTASVSGNNVSINCDTSSGTTCSVSPAGQTIGSNGGTISLLASNCGTGSWTSSRSGAPGGTGTSYSDTIPSSTSGGTYTYTFTGTSGSDSATVTQTAGTSGPPPPQTGSISCSSIAGISNTIVIPVSWQTTIGTGFTTSKAGSIAPGTAAVFVVEVPAGASSGGSQGSFRISPTNDQGYNMHIMSVSDSPCDFSRSLGTASVVQGQDIRLYFTVGGHAVDRYGRAITSIADRTPGRKYYFTVLSQQSVGGVNACTSSACNVNYGLTPGT